MRSQERAPTSVAYAETQSMTLDSLAGDAAWLGRYARNRCGAAPCSCVACMLSLMPRTLRTAHTATV